MNLYCRRFLSRQWHKLITLVEKKSKFESRHVDLAKKSEIPVILNELALENKSIQKASHSFIIAYRIDENGSIVHGFDDDGEKGAGSLLLDILLKYNLVNVMLITTRWMGGNKIGNSRFRLIRLSALESLRLGGKI